MNVVVCIIQKLQKWRASVQNVRTICMVTLIVNMNFKKVSCVDTMQHFQPLQLLFSR